MRIAFFDLIFIYTANVSFLGKEREKKITEQNTLEKITAIKQGHLLHNPLEMGGKKGERKRGYDGQR